MKGVANWLAAHRLRRVVVIAGLFPLPVFGLLSAATVVMATELKGPREALTDCLLAFAVLAGMGWIAGMDVPVLLATAAVSWAVWLGLGAVLARTGSLPLAIQAAVMLALVGMVVFQLAIGDPVVYWKDFLQEFYADLETQGLAVTADIEQQAGMMSGLVLAGSLTGAVMVLLLGTALADRVAGTRRMAQFPALRLGYVIGALAAVAGLAGLLGQGLGGVLVIFGAAFMFQGIAVVAWWARERGWPRGWWIGLCILPILLAEFMVIETALLAALGFADNWYNLRRRLQD